MPRYHRFPTGGLALTRNDLERNGPQKPVVVLLHGILQTPAIWDAVAAGLADVADVRRADFSLQSGIGEMAEDALALCGDSATVVGYSMGGYVALEMLAVRPAAIRSLVLLSASARAESAEQRARRERMIAMADTDFTAVIETLIRLGLHPANAGDEAIAGRLRALMRSVRPETYQRQCRAVMGRRDFRDTLRLAAVPVLVAHGEVDPVVPLETSDELVTLARDVQRRVIAGAGHTSPLEQPAVLAAMLRDWLADRA
jgi:pimeloyl-ACP methyl ester carboxylesterase